MKIVSRIATIEWKLNPSYYVKINKDNIVEDNRRLGSSMKAVNAMLARGELLRSLMPNILGIDPNSASSNWHQSVKRYFDSLSIPVPPSGLMLELGLEYDITSDKPHVVELLKSNSNIKTDEDLEQWVNGTIKHKPNVLEEFKFRYATPIKPEDYILWLYTWEYRDVANKLEDVNKSNFIKFYIVMEGELEDNKRKAFVKAEEANEKYMLAIKDSKKVDNMIYLYDLDPVDFKTDIDKNMFLKEQVNSNPDKFITVYDDKAIQVKADIERMIKKGVLNRLPNTSIIVDASEPDIVLGDTLYETVAYFNSNAQVKSAKVKELYTKLNSLNK